MKIVYSIILLSLFAFSPLSQPDEKNKIDRLGWLSGCWKKEGKTKDSYTIENWTPPAGMMLAVSRTVSSGRVRFFEYLRIEERPDGLYYVAKPANAKSETPFKLTKAEAQSALFENPEHDFPQRIFYARTGNEMDVRVTSGEGDKEKGFGFKMKKMSCDE